MHKPRHFALIIATFCGLVGLAPDAQAYLDPSTGSMILSAVVGLFATLGLAVKTYWYKLRSLVTRRGAAAPRNSSDDQAAGPVQDQGAGHSAGQANRPS